MASRVISFLQHLKKGLFLVGLASFGASLLAAPLDMRYSDAKLSLLNRITRDVLSYARSTVYPTEARSLVAHRFELTPIGAMLLKPQNLCVILINTNRFAWGLWPNFGDDASTSIEDVMEFAVWHELGHCYNKNVLPLMGIEPSAVGVASESFSDIFGLAMMRARYPEKDFANLVQGVLRGRDAFEGFLSSGHFTSPAIRKAQGALMEVSPAFLKDQSSFLNALVKVDVLKQKRDRPEPVSAPATESAAYNTSP